MRHVFRYAVPADPVVGEEIELPPDDSRHLARVVRRRPGDTIELIGPDGRLWPGVVVRTGPVAAVRATGEGAEPAPPRVALYQGLAEWGRLDMVAEKAVELGVGPLTLFASSASAGPPRDSREAPRGDECRGC